MKLCDSSVSEFGHTLVRVMGYCLVSDEPLPEHMMTFCQLYTLKQNFKNLNHNTSSFTQEKALEFSLQTGHHFVEASMASMH